MIRLNDHYQGKISKTAEQKRQVSTRGGPPRLEEDLLGGLRKSITNAQNRLALEYVFAIIDAQAAQIEELQDHINSLHLGPAKETPKAKETEAAEEPKRTRKQQVDNAPTEENV